MVQVRRGTPDDIPAIATVHVAAWQWAYRGQIPSDYLDSLDPAVRAKNWQRGFGDPEMPAPWVAVDHAGHVVGFCHASTSRDDDADSSVGEVTAIYIHHDQLGRGTGAALWNAAIGQLRELGCTTVTVWVLATNDLAIGFYRRMGLAPDGTTRIDELRGFPLDHLRMIGAIA